MRKGSPVHCRIGEVQSGAAVVLNDPGKDGILREVLEAAASLAIQKHEVLEVGDAPALPVACPASPAACALQLRRRLLLDQACIDQTSSMSSLL